MLSLPVVWVPAAFAVGAHSVGRIQGERDASQNRREANEIRRRYSEGGLERALVESTLAALDDSANASGPDATWRGANTIAAAAFPLAWLTPMTALAFWTILPFATSDQLAGVLAAIIHSTGAVVGVLVYVVARQHRRVLQADADLRIVKAKRAVLETLHAMAAAGTTRKSASTPNTKKR